MPLHSGAATAVILLLFVAGVQKLTDPSSTAGALRQAGLPSHRTLVRMLGLAEVVIGVIFLAVGGPWAALAGAVFYLGFAGFVGMALSRNLPISSCGCLGKTDTPPSMAHVVLNLGAAAVLVAAAIIPVQPMGGLLGQGASVVIPQVVSIAAVTYLLYGVLTALPLIDTRVIQRSTPLPAPGRRA
ncbi:MAG: DoxX family membrane protein [Actinomycetes bacterium]|jgi:hypothetical protein|nr:MAG: hypothetical protein DIU67_03825 [Actinomycetota bacterium]